MEGLRKLPPLPYKAWVDTRQVLHLICQIVGKVRMAHHPKINHWWHVPLYVGVDGLTTRAIPHANGAFEIRLDGNEHHLAIETANGTRDVCQLGAGNSVADIYGQLMASLDRLGYPTEIIAVPYNTFTHTPFSEATDFQSYDQEYVERYLSILQWLNREMTKFRGEFIGKSSPVHLFWHSFDLALTFFSGREAPPMPDADAVTKEAYSHEVISFGFWPGDEKVQMPALYSYTHPLPETLTDQELTPREASWNHEDGGVTAVLSYEVVRKSANPSEALHDFLQTALQAGVSSADWPELRAPWS